MSKREDILTAATDLFAEKGYDATSTAEIAGRAGVAHSTLFHHFKSKHSLLMELGEGLIDDFLAAARSAVEGHGKGLRALEAFVRLHFRFVRENPKSALVARRDYAHVLRQPSSPHVDRVRDRVERMHSLSRQCLEQGVADGSIRPVPVEAANRILHNLLSGSLKAQRPWEPDLPDLEDDTWEFCRQSLEAEE